MAYKELMEAWGNSPELPEKGLKDADWGVSSNDPYRHGAIRAYEQEIENDPQFARRCQGKGNFFFVNGAGGFDPEMRWNPNDKPSYWDDF